MSGSEKNGADGSGRGNSGRGGSGYDGSGRGGSPPSLAETRRLARLALWAALIGAGAWLSLPLPVGVPLSLQTFFVLLAGFALGPRRGAQAAGLYLLAGLAGLPVFAGGVGGPAILFSPGAGFALAFPLAAGVAGTAVRGGRRPAFPFLRALAATLIIHFCGWLGLMLRLDIPGLTAAAYLWPFIPGDMLKCAAAAALAASPAFRRLASLEDGRP